MEYLREEVDEKQDASTQTSCSGISDAIEIEKLTMTAWQEEKMERRTENCNGRIKTFGKRRYHQI